MNLSKSKKFFLLVLVIFIALILIWQFFIKSVIIKKGGEAFLSWDPSVEKNIKGYRIYYGLSPRTGTCPDGGYSEKIDIGNTTNYTIKNLAYDKTYYFSVTSYNQADKESCFSGEVSKNISFNIRDKFKKFKK